MTWLTLYVFHTLMTLKGIKFPDHEQAMDYKRGYKVI